jgi:ABC-type transport system substrate-binding protein
MGAKRILRTTGRKARSAAGPLYILAFALLLVTMRAMTSGRSSPGNPHRPAQPHVTVPASSVGQATDLLAQTRTGRLPLLHKRLPERPLSVNAVEIGCYGGKLHSSLLGGTERGYAGLREMLGYEPLIAWSPDDTKLIPSLAELSDISADSRAFTVHLRPGVPDGQPLTSKDYLFWYKDVALNKALSPNEPPHAFSSGGKPTRIERIDDYVGAGGLYEILNPRQYVSVNESALYGIGWARWYVNNASGQMPPFSTRLQLALFDKLNDTADPAVQADLFKRILAISADEFRLIGISLQSGGYAIASNRLGNVPDTMIDSTIYPTPGPANIPAWFIRSGAK